MYHCFRPGKTWYDTDGKRIQAHGGSVLYAEGTFFWYGENKEGITGTATGEKCTFCCCIACVDPLLLWADLALGCVTAGCVLWHLRE